MECKRRHALPALLGLAVFLCRPHAAMAQAPAAPSLGATASFAVLGGTRVESSGKTVVAGDVGVSPGSTVTGFLGFPPSSPPQEGRVILGTIFTDSATTRQAQKDSAAAYADLAGRGCTRGQADLANGPTGVYCGLPSPFPVKLILNAGSDPNPLWIFQIGGDLTIPPNFSIVVNGGRSGNVFWQVAGSATIGERSAFGGSLFARDSIKVGHGAVLSTRLLAQRGAVTLDEDDVSLCCDLITLSPELLPDGAVNAPYSATIVPAGGKSPYAFSLVSGSLPPGLTGPAPDGVISAKPLTPGIYTFTVLVTDAQGCAGIRQYTIKVCPNFVFLTPSPLPPATACVPYPTTTIMASGGTEFTSVPAVPAPGLNSLSLGGVITGTPSMPGFYMFVVTVRDPLTGCTASKTYTLEVKCPTITLLPDSLPTGMVNTPYTATILPGPCPGPYSISVDDPMNLPPGLGGPLLPLLPGGVISGTPRKAGVYTFTVTAVDTVTMCSGSRKYTITIDPCPLTLGPLTLPPATACDLYSVQLTPAGATFTVIGGTLPPGIPPAIIPGSIPGGLLTGTPTKPDTYKFTAMVTDTAGCSGTRDYTLVVGCHTIVLSPLVLAPATVGVFYSQTVQASGGKGTCAYSAVGLPAGLMINSVTGEISGIPTMASVLRPASSGRIKPSMAPGETPTVTATESCGAAGTCSGCTGMRTYTIRVTCGLLTISPATLPNGVVGAPYTPSLTLTGATGAPRFTLISGALPPGVSISPAGVFSGSPTTPGTFTFSIFASDAAGCTAGPIDYTVIVTPASCPPGTTIALAPATLPPANQGVPYGQTVVASGGTAPYTYAVTAGALPPGLTLNAATGLISGIPTAPGGVTVTITATDANGCIGSRVYAIPSVPALAGWGVAGLSLLLAAIGLAFIRRQS
jgi:hypothetical protein